MEKTNSLAKNAAFNVLYKILNILFPLISATYVARVLLPTGVGKVSYAQNIVSYFTMFAALGIPTYGVREIAKVRNSRSDTNKTFSELFIINAISTSFFCVLYSVVVYNFLKDNLSLYLVCGSLILFNYINIDWFYQGLEEYAYIAVRSSIIKVISVLMFFIFVHSEDDYLIYAIITVFGTGCNYIFNIFHARKYVQFTLCSLSFKQHVRPIIYLVICTISAELYSKIDVTMLGYYCADEIVGYYSNAQKTVNLVITLTTALSAIFLPRISYYFKNDKDKYIDYVSLGFKIVTFLCIPAFVGLICVSDNLTIVMFGESFAPAANTIRILSFLIPIKGIGDMLCYQVIISSGNEKNMIGSYIAAAVTNVLLNAVLIPVFYQNGAAIASVVSELVLNISLFVLVSSKIIKLKLKRGFFSGIILGTLIMVLLAFLTGNAIHNSIIALIIQVLVGVIFYFVINYLLKNETLLMILNKLKSFLSKGMRGIKKEKDV